MLFKEVTTNDKKIAVLDDAGSRLATLIDLKIDDCSWWVLQNVYSLLDHHELKRIYKKLKELNNANI